MNKEEIIYHGFDIGWGKDMPITLITYEDGSMDVHRQTGTQHRAHMGDALKILNDRGLTFDPNEKVGAYCTGIYYTVTRHE